MACSSSWFFSQFFSCSAGTVLNLAFVQEHLASFIKEKEDLQEALHAKWVRTVLGRQNHAPPPSDSDHKRLAIISPPPFIFANKSLLSCFEHRYESVSSRKLVFIHFATKTNFHMKSFALSLTFIMRFTATRKWNGLLKRYYSTHCNTVQKLSWCAQCWWSAHNR